MQCLFFFFNDTATTEIYTYGHTLSIHDALPISACIVTGLAEKVPPCGKAGLPDDGSNTAMTSRRPPTAPTGKPPPMTFPSVEIGTAHVCTPVTNAQLVCRLLLEQNK